MKVRHSEANEPGLLSADSIRLSNRGAAGALRIDMRIGAGELHLIRLRNLEHAGLIGDALLGLGDLSQGKVSYRGHDWRHLNEAEAFRLRRSIGRLQAQGNWMEQRSVLYSLLLPGRHHTLVDEQQLRRNAGDLARHFGLPGLPMQLPGDCSRQDLLRAGCVRAFLGRPRLVLLEHPIHQEREPGLAGQLIDAISRLRRQQGSAVWFVVDEALFDDPSVGATRRYRFIGSILTEVN